MTKCSLFGSIGSLQLLTLDSLKFIDFSDQALSRSCLIIDQTFQIILLGLFLVDHAIVPMLQVKEPFMQVLIVTHFLSELKCFELELGNFEILFVARTDILIDMLIPIDRSFFQS